MPLILTDADLNELLAFVKQNFRGAEADLLAQWLNAKLQSQLNRMTNVAPPEPSAPVSAPSTPYKTPLLSFQKKREKMTKVTKLRKVKK